MAKKQAYKLSTQEKEHYRYMKKLYSDNMLDFIQSGAASTTLAVVTIGNHMRIASSVCGNKDKYNAKRGRYEALRALYSGYYITLPKGAVTGGDWDGTLEITNIR